MILRLSQIMMDNEETSNQSIYIFVGIAIAPRPRAPTEAWEGVGLALTTGGLVGSDVRVLGVSGTATQYQLSSYKRSSVSSVPSKSVYGKWIWC